MVLAAMLSYSLRDFAGGEGHFCDPPDPGDRASQVMGDIVAHLLDLREQGLNAVQHLIEGGCELIDFIAPGFHGNPFFKGASGYLLGRPSDCFDAGDRPPGHEPTDACGQHDQEGHGGDEDSLEGIEKSGIAFHGLSHLQNDAGAEHGIEDTDFLLAVWNGDGFKDRSAATKQLLYGRFINSDIFPVGHVGRGEDLSVQGEETKEDLFHPGCLGFNHGSALDRFEPLLRQGALKTD